ncbi:serine/threonine protein kinase, partial [Streptomyces sp. NPDC059853]
VEPRGAEPGPLPAAVPLVHPGLLDDERATHTRMRVPGPEELAGGAHGTARTPRAPGQARAGSARHQAASRRRRRLAVTVAAGVAAAAALGGWLLAGGDDGTDDGRGTGETAEQDLPPTATP